MSPLAVIGAATLVVIKVAQVRAIVVPGDRPFKKLAALR